ncbi:MAG: carbohydrate porin [Burkholderiales bacterium]
MGTSRPFRAQGWRIAAIAVLAGVPFAPAGAQEAAPPAGDDEDVSAVGKIGNLHEKLRADRQRGTLYQRISGAYADYTQWKAQVEKDTGLAFSMELSFLQQWGRPNGGSPALQIDATPSLDWTVFRSSVWGTGSLQVAYDAVPTYPTRRDAAAIGSSLGVVTPINDIDHRSLIFAQLSWTQATPDNKWLATIGQYPLWNFDGNEFLDNQQQNFNSYILSQNGSSTYRATGWGAYVQWNATPTIQLVGGVQATNNLSGQTLTTRNASKDCCTWFGYAQWTPRFAGMGAAQYSVAYFDTPAVPAQPASRNWSVNAVQHLSSTWALFGRANGASGYAGTIRNSYALGAAMIDPLSRAPTDQVALAVGVSDLAGPPATPAGARDEKVIEAYWTWTFFGGLLVTPSLQVIVDPALDPARRSVSVLALRATLLF